MSGNNSRPATTMERGRVEAKKNGLFIPIACVYFVYFCCIVFFVTSLSLYLGWFTLDSEYKFDQIIGFSTVTIPLVLALIFGILQSAETQ